MTKRIVIAAFLLCLLAACGNKGPLVMPDKAPEADAPAVEAPASDDAGAPAAGTPARR